MGFTDSSVGKESNCNAGDPSSIPGLGKSPAKGKAYPLQYSWASRVAQLVKNPPAMQETWVQPLGWEDPLEKGNSYPLQYSGLENSMDCIVHGVAKSRTRLSNFDFLSFLSVTALAYDLILVELEGRPHSLFYRLCLCQESSTSSAL